MDRVVRRVPLTLIAGAAVTLAIAWGLPLLPWQRELRRSPAVEPLGKAINVTQWQFACNPLTTEDQAWLDAIDIKPLPSIRCCAYPLRSRTICFLAQSRTEVIEAFEFDLDCPYDGWSSPPPIAAVITSAGWPLECLACIQWRERAAPAFDSWTPEWRLRGGFALGSSATTPTFTNGVADPPPVLPFTIAPGAFLIDSIANGAIIALLFTVFGAVRRRAITAWRINRGRCPSCGYPAGAAAACTECGAKLKPAA